MLSRKPKSFNQKQVIVHQLQSSALLTPLPFSALNRITFYIRKNTTCSHLSNTKNKQQHSNRQAFEECCPQSVVSLP